MKRSAFVLTPTKIAVAIASILACSTIQASTSFENNTHTWVDADNDNAVHFRGSANDSTPIPLQNGQNINFVNTSSRWILGDYPADFSYSLRKIAFTANPTAGAHKFFAVLDGSDQTSFNQLDPNRTYMTIDELRLGLNTALQFSGNTTDKTAVISRVVVTTDIPDGQDPNAYDRLINSVNIQAWACAYGQVTGDASSFTLPEVIVEDNAVVTFSARNSTNESYAQASSVKVSQLTLNDNTHVLSGYSYGGSGTTGRSAGTTLFEKVSAAGDADITIDNGTLTLGKLDIASGKKLTVKSNETMVATAGTSASVAGVDNNLNVTLAGASTLTLNAPTADETTMSVATAANAPGQVCLGTQATLTGDAISVVSAGDQSTGDTQNDLNVLAKVVVDAAGANVAGVQITQKGNDLFDEASATTTAQGGLANVSVVPTAHIHGIAEMTTLGLISWRSEINDMNKRLGELRDSSEESNGVWARVYNGKSKYGDQDVTAKYTSFQFGYDRQIVPGTWLGAALSYTDGDNDFKQGSGDSTLYALTGYASWLAGNGMFLDVTGKVGRMKNSFDIGTDRGVSSGSYHTNTVSMSAEAGWRFYPMQNEFFVEPQVELMYGHVYDADYTTSLGIKVSQDATDTLVGRAGFVLGVKCPENRGNAYIRASVLHDWKGDASSTFTNGTQSRTLSEDFGDTWYEFGIGANYNATQNVHLYADLEATADAMVETSYRFNLGVRYAW